MPLVNPSIKILMLLSLVFSVPANTEPPKANVMVVGDIMMHATVTMSGYDSGTGEYNYDRIFEKVTPIFDQADLVIGNLETPLAGKEIGYSGYPRFNAPESLVSSLKKAGVDVLTTANNHSMDQWETGVLNTIEHIDQFGLLHTGTFRSIEEKNKPLIVEKKGIKIGILATTYGTNGLPVPMNKPYLVNLLNMETINEEVEKLRRENVDYIMAMVHFGTEYVRYPTEEQQLWTRQLLDSGIDFVLGSHPHVVEPIKIYKGDEKTSDKGVIYSLGNFISAQRWDWKDYGVILNLELEKEFGTNKIRIKNVSAIPTYVTVTKSNGNRQYQVVPLTPGQTSIDRTTIDRGNELIQHVFQYESTSE